MPKDDNRNIVNYRMDALPKGIQIQINKKYSKTKLQFFEVQAQRQWKVMTCLPIILSQASDCLKQEREGVVIREGHTGPSTVAVLVC